MTEAEKIAAYTYALTLSQRARHVLWDVMVNGDDSLTDKEKAAIRHYRAAYDELEKILEKEKRK